MDDLNVIDEFLQLFIQYIDAGFGLLGPDVHFLTATLIAIDVTLAALFWSLSGEADILARLVRKTLYVGAFTWIIGSFSTLGDIVFRSFARAGLTAGGGTLSADDLLRPGRLAGTGFSAAWPLAEQASEMMGFTSFFDNFLTIAILLFAWALVIIAFFILAVQMFVTIVEFKLTALAGFILIPFALWNRTGFLAERVLGNVVSSGIKVMVLAVIVGIGSNLFDQFTTALDGQEPDIGQAMSLVLASLTLFGLGIFGPAIASGLVSGAPQLGAGAALGTTAGAAGLAIVGGSAVASGGRALAAGGLGAIRAGTAMGAATSTAYGLGQQASGNSTMSAGLAGIARTATNAARDRAGAVFGITDAAEQGRSAANEAFFRGSSETRQTAGPSAETSGAPEWAASMRAEQTARHHRHVALQAVKEGDRGGASANPDIAEKED